MSEYETRKAKWDAAWVKLKRKVDDDLQDYRVLVINNTNEDFIGFLFGGWWIKVYKDGTWQRGVER